MVKVKTNSLYHRPKRSSNKIRILLTKIEFGKNEFNIPTLVVTSTEVLNGRSQETDMGRGNGTVY